MDELIRLLNNKKYAQSILKFWHRLHKNPYMWPYCRFCEKKRASQEFINQRWAEANSTTEAAQYLKGCK